MAPADGGSIDSGYSSNKADELNQQCWKLRRQKAFSLGFLISGSPETVLPIFGVAFSVSLREEIPHGRAQRPPSWMTLDLVKLTTDSDHDISGQFQSPSTCPPPPHPLLFLRQLLGDSPGTCGPGSCFCVSVTHDNRRKATPGREGLLWLSFRGFLTHCEGEGMAGLLGSW